MHSVSIYRCPMPAWVMNAYLHDERLEILLFPVVIGQMISGELAKAGRFVARCVLWQFREMQRAVQQGNTTLMTEYTSGWSAVGLSLWICLNRSHRGADAAIWWNTWFFLLAFLGFLQVILARFGSTLSRAVMCALMAGVWCLFWGILLTFRGFTPVHAPLMAIDFAVFLSIFVLMGPYAELPADPTNRRN